MKKIEKFDDSHYIGVMPRLIEKINELIDTVNEQQVTIDALKITSLDLKRKTSGLSKVGPRKRK